MGISTENFKKHFVLLEIHRKISIFHESHVEISSKFYLWFIFFFQMHQILTDPKSSKEFSANFQQVKDFDLCDLMSIIKRCRLTL